MSKMMQVLGELPLERVQLFRDVTRESLQGIVDSCDLREIASGEILLRPESVNHELFILLAGRLRVHLKDLDSDPVATLEPGEVAGELSVLDGKPTSAYVVVDEPGRVMVMPRELVWSLATVSHAAACNLLTILSGRVRQADRTITEQMLRERSFHCYGTVDALTGMHNRYWLNDMLGRMVTRSIRSGTPLAVMMIDIDNFKEFDDSYGHLCGDRAIHTVAQTILDNLRPTVLTARYGGDEFFVAVPGVVVGQALEIAERLREAVAATPIPHSPAPLAPVTVSIGVAGVSSGHGVDDVIAAADAALYRAKALGRNRVSQ
ncbi:GGDEF domain-containing protein [Geomonas paludis]|uniref:diguanylate cyclase n=1 Tax=Geomonas paludis TaxID=2740185 RepID=A0A6V8MV47_9BACT|nr:GGDEF domain-containing protein [Geomonas paludis]UPU35250.1 GGDEF domain-containing protein [Geomonas paludis]GFO63199.1 diguanylate cyclase [Geomonas paludis]